MTSTDTPLDTSRAFRERVRFVVVLVLAALAGVYVFWITRQALLLVFLGVALGVLFYRMSAALARWTHVPRGVALAFVLLGTIGGIGAAAVLGLPQLVSEAQALIASAPELLESARVRLGLPESAFALPPGSTQMVGQLLGIFSSAFGVLAAVAVVVLMAVFVSVNPRQYVDAVVQLFDRKNQPFVRDLLHDSARMLFAWLQGVGVSVSVLGTMAIVGLLVLGLPGALALGVFAAALTVIPNIGPLIGWAPAVLVAFSQGTSTGLWALGLAVLSQQIEGNFITPKVQGAMVSVKPAFIVAGQVVLGALSGFLGVALVVPILGVGAVLVRRLYIGPFVEGVAADPDSDA